MDAPKTVVELFQRSVAKYPDKVAVVFMGTKLTYKELDKASDDFAKFLACMGVMEGDRVSFVLGNCPQFVIAYLGVLKRKAVVAAVNPLVATEEVMATVNQANSTFVITLENFSEHNRALYEKFNAKMLMVSIGDFLPWPINWLYWLKTRKEKFFRPKKVFNWRQVSVIVNFRDANIKLLKSAGELLGELRNAFDQTRSPADLAVLQTTGGTTGVPKLAMLTNQNIVANCLQGLEHINQESTVVDENTVFLGVIPFFHVYGLSVCLNLAFAAGSSVVILPKFASKDVLKAIQKHRVDIFPAITRMYAALVDFAEKNPGDYRAMCESLRVCVSGAGALDLTVKAKWEKLTGKEIIEGYGLSEASPIVSVNPIRGAKTGSMGTLVPGTEMRLAHQDTDEPIDEGGAGELWVRGPQVMLGYWQNTEETKAAINADGWLATGDMVRVDEEGFLWFVDRKKDMVKISGENVYPKSIEDVIRSCQVVADVAVFGLPDEKTGERLVACVVLKPGSDAKEAPEVIHAHCRNSHLSGIKIPKQIVLVDEIPKTIVGKVLKRVLKEKLLNK